jgi:hypothetical protein
MLSVYAHFDSQVPAHRIEPSATVYRHQPAHFGLPAVALRTSPAFSDLEEDAGPPPPP